MKMYNNNITYNLRNKGKDHFVDVYHKCDPYYSITVVTPVDMTPKERVYYIENNLLYGTARKDFARKLVKLRKISYPAYKTIYDMYI